MTRPWEMLFFEKFFIMVHADTNVQTQLTANFIHNDIKVADWRYENYLKLIHRSSRVERLEEIIHWIGVIELEKIGIQRSSYNISYANKFWELENDSEKVRYDDGARTENHQTKRFEYNLHEIIESLSKAKESGYNYFHIFIEEKVEQDGSHLVSLLYSPNQEQVMYGIPTHNPWFKLPTKNWAMYSNFVIDELARICILSQKPYNWMK